NTRAWQREWETAQRKPSGFDYDRKAVPRWRGRRDHEGRVRLWLAPDRLEDRGWTGRRRHSGHRHDGRGGPDDAPRHRRGSDEDHVTERDGEGHYGGARRVARAVTSLSTAPFAADAHRRQTLRGARTQACKPCQSAAQTPRRTSWCLEPVH